MQTPDPALAYEPVQPEDFDSLADLRIAAMRPSLERIGRYDPVRARERLRANFTPADTEHIVLDGARVGFVVIRDRGDHLLLDHLYLWPDTQGQGVGAAVLTRLFAQADTRGLPVRVGALRDSDANRFYQRHGFTQVSEDEFDVYYVRAPRTQADARP